MTVETEVLPYLTWLPQAVLFFLMAALAVGLSGLLFGYLVAALRHGPLAGGDVTFQVLTTGVGELVRLSPRRIFAIAKLAVQESIRRRVVVAFAVFLVILLFAGWYLDNSVANQSKLYLSFVLSWTTYLVLLLALFLSVFSLPGDIKNRTIYTIVTKPVRPGEIVLGRILGFTAVGTALLGVMGVFSYLFVVRAVDHTHAVVVLDSAEVAASGGVELRTTTSQNHRHDIGSDGEGGLATDFREGHWHQVAVTERGGEKAYEVGPPLGMLTARVPVYASELRFFDRAGKPTEKGVNTGSEWTYRSYIEGGTQAAAIWEFQGITADRFPREQFPNGIPLELTIRVFRTHKGDIEKGIAGSIVIRNPQTGVRSASDTFLARDFHVDRREIKWQLKDAKGQPLDLMEDLVSDDGRMEIWLSCLEPGQYYGMAKADIYLKARDGSFTANFVKGYLGIWSQMVLVIGFGVMFSTFLNGAVAMLATLGTIVLGFFTDFIRGVSLGTFTDVQNNPDAIMGGGPIESLIRIVTQRNVILELEDNLANTIAKMIDQVLLFFMQAVAYIAPNFSVFDNSSYVAHGYDIPGDMVSAHVTRAIGYIAAVFVAGYFFLKTREVAK